MALSGTTNIKTVSENRLYTINFADAEEIIAGETIASITSLTVTPSGLTAGSPAIVGDTVQVRLSGGTLYERYKVACVVLTNQGNTLEGGGYLLIE